MIINGGTIRGGTVYDQSDLYAFTTFTFSGNLIGQVGPTLGNLYNYYTNAGNTWITNTNYFTVPNAWRGYQVWTVPRTGFYQITAAGSRSGLMQSNTGVASYGNSHGRGAIIQSTFNLTRGQQLTILAGQPSANVTNAGFNSPGGGGGSFVMLGNIATGFANVSPLIIAGGGGGGGSWTSNTSIYPGGYGVTTKRGGNSAGNASATLTTLRFGAPGGINGLGGNTHVSVGGTTSTNTYDSGAGGGWSGNGVTWTGSTWSTSPFVFNVAGGGSGNSIQFGAVGGVASTSYAPPATSAGGFGGGGGSGPITGGGGGGYSGGGGTYSGGNPAVDSGGGGGSYIDGGASSVATSDGLYDLANTFNGVSITSLGTFNNAAGYISIVRL